MRNLLRAAAACALALIALSSVEAALFGTCVTRCYTSSSFTFVTTSTTGANCCSESYNPCPAGTTPVPVSFNGRRC
ncbi:MAG TPA: hypothetical protein VMW27_23215 [Thermoanaerobaculia bacterium]|nr:hypothetical protein [Thermoanaerobaculia bacterium]